MAAPAGRGERYSQRRCVYQPWQYGSCYDTYNETGNENGPASSKVASALWNPELLTVGETAPLPLGGIEAAAHEANCDVVVKEGG